MTIDWIPVATRVPDDRREVLTWGYGQGYSYSGPRFLGASRCNLATNGHRFDIERRDFLGTGLRSYVVTHWAEITPPVL